MRGNGLSNLSTGALAIFAMALLVTGIAASQEKVLHSFGNGTDRAAETSRKEAQIAIFREQPHAKVIVIPNSTHFIFLSNESEVISQISNFVNSLPAKR